MTSHQYNKNWQSPNFHSYWQWCELLGHWTDGKEILSVIRNYDGDVLVVGDVGIRTTREVEGDGEELTKEQVAALRVLYARTLVAGDGCGNGETEESANRISQNASIRELIGQVGDHPDLNEVVELRSEPQDGGEGGAE